MKRIFLIAAVAATMLASCESTANKAEDQAQDFRSRIESCNDTDSIKFYVEEAVSYAKTLADKGKVDEAVMYLNDIQSTVSTKAPEMLDFFNATKSKIDALPVAKADSIADRAHSGVDSLKSAAVEAGEAVKDKTVETAKAAKDAAVSKAENVADAAKEKTGQVKDAAKEKADEAKAAASKLLNN